MKQIKHIPIFSICAILTCSVVISSCRGVTYRDPRKCYIGKCLKDDKNWSECYKNCTCGCYKNDSNGYYPEPQ